MTTPLTGASRSAMAAQIATLDFQINKLNKLANSSHLEKGSLMVSGKNSLYAPYHELVIWDSSNPLPKDRLKSFLEAYKADLMKERDLLLSAIDGGETDFKDQTRQAHCTMCNRPTTHRNYQLLPGSQCVAIPLELHTWICNECETILTDKL